MLHTHISPVTVAMHIAYSPLMYDISYPTVDLIGICSTYLTHLQP